MTASPALETGPHAYVPQATPRPEMPSRRRRSLEFFMHMISKNKGEGSVEVEKPGRCGGMSGLPPSTTPSRHRSSIAKLASRVVRSSKSAAGHRANVSAVGVVDRSTTSEPDILGKSLRRSHTIGSTDQRTLAAETSKGTPSMVREEIHTGGDGDGNMRGLNSADEPGTPVLVPYKEDGKRRLVNYEDMVSELGKKALEDFELMFDNTQTPTLAPRHSHVASKPLEAEHVGNADSAEEETKKLSNSETSLEMKLCTLDELMSGLKEFM